MCLKQPIQLIFYGLLLFLVPVTFGLDEFQIVTDVTGNYVQIPKYPERILSLTTSSTDIIIRLGETPRISGIDEYSRIVPGASNLTVLAKGSAISLEQIMARQIDLAFVWWYQDDIAKALTDLNVPVLRIQCNRAKDIPYLIRFIGKSLGISEKSELLAKDVSQKLQSFENDLIAKTNQPTVYMELYTPFKTYGRDSYLDDLIKLAGGKNIASDACGPILLSSEQLILKDPQVIILFDGFCTVEQFSKRTGLNTLSAIKNKKVHVIDRYYLVAGTGISESVKYLNQLIYK